MAYISKRLLKIYNGVSTQDRLTSKGWYLEANKLAHGLAVAFLKGDLYKACSVIAVLSPACSWDINKKDAQRLIEAFYHRGRLGAMACKVSTYGQNKKKAVDILAGLITFTPTKTNTKTYSFAQNMFKPYCTEHVTIDRHAIKAYKGVTKGGSVTVTPKEYKQASEAYKALAEHVGVLPCEVQAIVWDGYKEKVGR